MRSLSFHAAGLLADTVNDADSTRKVYLLAAGLAALGVALIVITTWFWRNTRNDPELLGPLEVLGSRGFRKLDSRAQQQLLDSARPADAAPIREVEAVDDASEPEPEIDLKTIDKSARSDFDDLRDDAAEPAAAPVVDNDGDVAQTEVPAELPAEAPTDVSGESSVEGESLPVESTEVEPPETSDVPGEAPDAVDVAEAESVDEVDDDDRAVVAEAAEPAIAVPLLIVPIDHDLPVAAPEPSFSTAAKPVAAATTSRPVDSETQSEAAAEQAPEPAPRGTKPSIDPLLRKFSGNGG